MAIQKKLDRLEALSNQKQIKIDPETQNRINSARALESSTVATIIKTDTTSNTGSKSKSKYTSLLISKSSVEKLDKIAKRMKTKRLKIIKTILDQIDDEF